MSVILLAFGWNRIPFVRAFSMVFWGRSYYVFWGAQLNPVRSSAVDYVRSQMSVSSSIAPL